ncbi:MAG: hypothetical protein HQM13_10470 [SAR324 cluster bacterium]|nr:hypothetical protein [SAR324 cluster bacterium]
MTFFKKHIILWASLLVLIGFSTFSEILFQNEWYRFFYLFNLLGSLSICYGILSIGEALRQILLHRRLLLPCYSGFNFAVSAILGIGLLGNIAILGALLTIDSARFYKLVFLSLVLLSSIWTAPKILLLPISRLFWNARQLGKHRWIWFLPLLLFIARFSTTFLPVNGTEQLHNTLPYASFLLRGVNFYEYNQDNHFLLLGVYESLNVFLLSITTNLFAYHIVAQQVTFLLFTGSLILLLSTFPYVLKRWPAVSVVMAIWPTTLNFAATDTIAFKPDWFAVLSAFLATGYLMRQWMMQKQQFKKGNSSMWSVILFSALAVSNKLTAVNYVIFILAASVLLSIFRHRRLHYYHCLTPFVFLVFCSVFLIKNAIWLGNPVYPGFQQILPKSERLAQTATFNTFQINKETLKVPGFLDYIRGYTRFVEPKNHAEFLLIFALAGFLFYKRKERTFLLTSLTFFLSYITLICLMFYPDIYQRYVAFTYIILLSLTIYTLLAAKDLLSPQIRKGMLILFSVIMLSHARVEAHIQDSMPWWWQGISPREYRIEKDSLSKFYFEINEKCEEVGTLLNRKWRSFLYADFTTINMTDLPGDLFSADYHNRHNVNFVITPANGETETKIRNFQDGKNWFAQNFSVVSNARDTTLWKRNSWNKCNAW